MSAASKYYITWLHAPGSAGSWSPDLALTLNNLVKESNPQTLCTFIEVANFLFYKIGKNSKGKSIKGYSNWEKSTHIKYCSTFCFPVENSLR